MESSEGNLTSPRTLSDAHTRSSSRARSPRRQETDDSEKAGRVWARHPEPKAWAPCVLTLDGGGIRGYSSLLILKALMHEVWLWECRLDKEEQSSRGQHRPARTSEQCDDQEQAVASAQVLNEVDQEPENPAEERQTTTTNSGVDHMQQDGLTPISTTKKAMSEEELLPCHYFDFMYGTSTGGLIALLLGRLRMTVTEGLELYRKVGDDLFGRRRSHIPLMTKYHHEPLETAVRDIVAKRCHEHAKCDGNDMHPFDCDRLEEILSQPVPFHVDRPRVCQSCCLTATHDANISEAYLLRSYPHLYREDAPNWITRYNEGADALAIWQTARATTAAPFYFKMVKAVVDNVEKSFKDGGIRENNPSGAALSEFHALYEGTGTEVPALMLSVGTGRPDTSQDGFASAWPGPFGHLPFVSKFLEKRAVIQNLLIKYTEGEKQHHQMREHAHGENTWYKRLNVSHGLESMPLDAWVKGDWQGQSNTPGGASLSHMEEATKRYLHREFDPAIDSYGPPKTMLEQAAEKLVRQRRARERLGDLRWDTFVGKHLHHHKGAVNGNAG